MIRSIAPRLVLVGVVGPGCLDLESARQPTTVDVLAQVLDVSDSGPGPHRCSEIGPAVRAARLQAEFRRIDLLVVATGGPDSSDEPRVLVDWTPLVPDLTAYKEDDEGEKDMQARLRVLAGTCHGRVRGGQTTPLYRAVSRALGALRARCEQLARQGAVCGRRMLEVHSDMRETEARPIVRALARSSTDADPALRALALPVDAGTAISVCGVSQVDKRTRGVRPERVEPVWRVIFGAASPTAFDAGCARDRAEPGGARP